MIESNGFLTTHRTLSLSKFKMRGCLDGWCALVIQTRSSQTYWPLRPLNYRKVPVLREPVDPVAIPVACSRSFLISELPLRGKVQNAIFDGRGFLSRNLDWPSHIQEDFSNSFASLLLSIWITVKRLRAFPWAEVTIVPFLSQTYWSLKCCLNISEKFL